MVATAVVSRPSRIHLSSYLLMHQLLVYLITAEVQTTMKTWIPSLLSLCHLHRVLFRHRCCQGASLLPTLTFSTRMPLTCLATHPMTTCQRAPAHLLLRKHLISHQCHSVESIRTGARLRRGCLVLHNQDSLPPMDEGQCGKKMSSSKPMQPTLILQSQEQK
jgi:hypothetical protein